MESLQILLKQMGESKVVLIYTKLPKQILATYYRDKHISVIGINRPTMMTKGFEFEVFKAAIGLHKTLSGTEYKIIIDDNNIDMLAPIGEAILERCGLTIDDKSLVDVQYPGAINWNRTILLTNYKVIPKAKEYKVCNL